MGQKEKFEFSLDKLELLPLEEAEETEVSEASNDTEQSIAAEKAIDTERPLFRVDKRSNEDRREIGDRRASIRFEDERRNRIDRRGASANWDTL